MDVDITLAVAEISAVIKAIETSELLSDEANFHARADALDFLEIHVNDRLATLFSYTVLIDQLNLLKQSAEKLTQRLEGIDHILFKRLRESIRIKALMPPSFAEVIGTYTGYDYDHCLPSSEIGYNTFDHFINGLLHDQAVPEPTLNREDEMVYYQQTPARVMFELASKLKTNDMLFDLGSGLGQVGILVNLLTGVVTKGIEYEPAYYSYATACASGLNLDNVAFINCDARAADYSLGTVFFLYTPFSGKLLEEVLSLLETEAKNRMIRIFTYGPCSVDIGRLPWLKCKNGGGNEIYKLYEFISI